MNLAERNEEKNDEKLIGKKLAVLAKLKGVTQEQLAQNCEISRISVNRFFRQHTEIRSGDLANMLKALGINLEMLIDRAIETQMNSSHSVEDPIQEIRLPFTERILRHA